MAAVSGRSAAVKLKETLQVARERLLAAGVENPRLDAELLMAFAAGVTRERLLTDSIVIDDAVRERYATLIDRRAARTPLAYIVGKREFYSLELEVSPEVLIPRPDTETVVATALAYVEERRAAFTPAPRIIDLGTGSGAIALAIAANAPRAQIVATDVSAQALAARNAARLSLATQVEFRRADCWEVIDAGAPLGRFDLIVANPPYIREDQIASLAPEIREFEPRLALAGGPDGLAFYRRIAAGVASHLSPGGALMVEIGQGQGADVAAIFRSAGLGEVAVIDDLAGVQRVFVASLQARPR